VQQIAFDRGWLLRVPSERGVETLQYALVPWHTASSRHTPPHLALDEPPGMVRTPLRLRCGGDPLGGIHDGGVVVPRRVETHDPAGWPVTLIRRRSDGELFAQEFFGMMMQSLGGAAAFYGGIPLLVVAASDSKYLPIGVAVFGGGLTLMATGLTLFFTARTQVTLRNGTQTR
jgi:hypothetical protein